MCVYPSNNVLRIFAAVESRRHPFKSKMTYFVMPMSRLRFSAGCALVDPYISTRFSLVVRSLQLVNVSGSGTLIIKHPSTSSSTCVFNCMCWASSNKFRYDPATFSWLVWYAGMSALTNLFVLGYRPRI